MRVPRNTDRKVAGFLGAVASGSAPMHGGRQYSGASGHVLDGRHDVSRRSVHATPRASLRRPGGGARGRAVAARGDDVRLRHVLRARPMHAGARGQAAALARPARTDRTRAPLGPPYTPPGARGAPGAREVALPARRRRDVRGGGAPARRAGAGGRPPDRRRERQVRPCDDTARPSAADDADVAGDEARASPRGSRRRAS